MISSTDAAYAAGLVDGEGCVTVASNGDGYIVCRLAVGMKDGHADAIQWLYDTFSCGSLNRSVCGPNSVVMLYWTVSGHSARPVLEAIAPYVRTKKEQVELALAFLSLPKNSRDPRHQLIREELASRMKQAKA